jgi:hypothetical protein
MQDCYRLGLAWLASSGIQAASGGLSRYYRADLGRYTNISTEITAYGIQAYLQLPLPGETGLLSNALRAGQFLCYDAADPEEGAFPFEVSPDSVPPARTAYFFDCAILIRALLALWNSTADAMYLERAERCGATLLERMSRVDGSFFPLLDMASGVPSVGSGTWSLEPGPHQLKAGMAFLELAEVTSSGMFSKTAELLLAWCLRTHELFLPGDTHPERVVDRLHAYCYFLEGLLPFLERHFEGAQLLQAGMTRVEEMAGERRDVLERCDVAAQLLRLRLFSEYAGIAELDVSAAEREAEHVRSFQIHSADRRTNGAFSFGRRQGQLAPYANPVATIFALQALRMWQDYQGGALRPTWHEII